MLRRLVLVIFVGALGIGCGTTNNFRAYYNTFYNAKRAYNDGYKSIEKKDESVNLDVYLPLFVRPSGSIGSRDFESAVTKSADILRNHSDTKWVDDALLLIGKSYFYQENVVGALEKFREVIDRGTDLENEARFWLARTLVTSRSYEAARTILDESITREDVPKEWLAMYNLALGELFVRQSLWEEAAAALSSGLKESKDKETSARAQFLLGQVYEMMGLWDEAYQAYSAVRKKNPLYELSFASKLSSGRVDAFHVEFERGVKSIRKLERDDKNITYAAQIKLVRGRALRNGGQEGQAYMIFDELLYGETDLPMSADLRGRVHYALADYYRLYEIDFVRAGAHYDSAAISIVTTGAAAVGRNSTATQYSTEAITDADEMKDSFGEYARVYEKGARLDSLLWLGGLDSLTFDDQIMEYRVALGKEMAERRRLRNQRQLEQQFRQTGESTSRSGSLPAGKVITPSRSNDLERSGYLHHRDPAQVEEGIANFEIRWGDRPLVSNWRRISAIIVRSEEELMADAMLDVASENGVQEELPEIDVSAVPRDSLSQATMRSERSVVRYDLGNSLFLAMGMPDSAAVLYRLVIEGSGDAPVARRAFYALAEVQRALGDTLSADRLYDEILNDYPESDFAVRIRTQRGLLPEVQEIDLAAIAETEYQEIYRRWQTGTALNIVDDMLSLAAAYPETEARAMALLATGTIHLESAGADSVLILEPVSTSLPDSLLGEIWPDKIHVVNDSTLTEDVAIIADQDSLTTLVDSDSLGVLAARDSLAVSVPKDSLAVSVPEDSLTVSASQDSVIVSVPKDSLAVSVPEDSLIVPVTSDSLFAFTQPDSTVGDSLELNIAEAAGDSTSTELAPNEPDSLSIAFAQLTEPGYATSRDPIFVEDLYETVASEFAGTDYANHALAILTAVTELRVAKEKADNPVAPDSLRLALEADSLRQFEDAEGLVGQDSTSFVPADSSESSVIPADSVLTSSEAPAKFGGATIAPEETEPSGKPAKLGGEAGTPVVPVAAAIPIARSPGNASVTVKDVGDEPERFPSFGLVDEDLGNDEFLELDSVKPLMSNGEPDMLASGWTIVLQWAVGAEDAQAVRQTWADTLSATGIDVLVLADVSGQGGPYRVAWGIFETKEASVLAVEERQPALPENYSYMRLLPLTE